jgi:hypothetical protein
MLIYFEKKSTNMASCCYLICPDLFWERKVMVAGKSKEQRLPEFVWAKWIVNIF